MVDCAEQDGDLAAGLRPRAAASSIGAGLAVDRNPLAGGHRSAPAASATSTDVVASGDVQLRRPGPAPLHACGLKDGPVCRRLSELQHGLLNKGPSALVHRPDCFASERPRGRSASSTSSVRTAGFADPAADAEAIAIAWDLLDSPAESGICPGDQLLGDCLRRSHYRSVRWNGSEARRRPARPEAQGDQHKPGCEGGGILDSKKSENPRPCSPPQYHLLGALSQRQQQQRFERCARPRAGRRSPISLNPRLVKTGLDYYTTPPLRSPAASSAPRPRLRRWPLRRPDRAARWQAPQRRSAGPSAWSGWCCSPGQPWPPAMHPLAAAQVYRDQQGRSGRALCRPLLGQDLRQAGCRGGAGSHAAAFAKNSNGRSQRSSWALLIGEGKSIRGLVILKNLACPLNSAPPAAGRSGVGREVLRLTGPQPFSSQRMEARSPSGPSVASGGPATWAGRRWAVIADLCTGHSGHGGGSQRGPQFAAPGMVPKYRKPLTGCYEPGDLAEHGGATAAGRNLHFSHGRWTQAHSPAADWCLPVGEHPPENQGASALGEASDCAGSKPQPAMVVGLPKPGNNDRGGEKAPCRWRTAETVRPPGAYQEHSGTTGRLAVPKTFAVLSNPEFLAEGDRIEGISRTRSGADLVGDETAGNRGPSGWSMATGWHRSAILRPTSGQ